MLLERVTAQALADRQGAHLAAAFGAEVAMPDIDARIAAFDAELVAEPKRLDPNRELLLRALGVRRGR